MKKGLLLALALLLVSSSAFATNGWLDLFSNQTQDGWCLTLPTGTNYIPIEVYVYARPPQNVCCLPPPPEGSGDPVSGFRATECKIILPDPCMSIVSEAYPPEMNLTYGSWLTGMSLSFSACMIGNWVYVAHLSILCFPPGLAEGCQVIELAPRDDNGFFGMATCAEGYPVREAAHAYDVYVNCEPCPDIVAVKESSWGAIKNIYNE